MAITFPGSLKAASLYGLNRIRRALLEPPSAVEGIQLTVNTALIQD
jgi:hypothetical protein